MHFPPQTWMKQRAHKSGCTPEFCIPMIQTVAPTETEDNPADYWHYEGILVRFHNNPQHQLNHRLTLRHTAAQKFTWYSQGKYTHFLMRGEKNARECTCSKLTQCLTATPLLFSFLLFGPVCELSCLVSAVSLLFKTSGACRGTRARQVEGQRKNRQGGRERWWREERTVYNTVSKRTKRKEDRGEWKRERDTLLH